MFIQKWTTFFTNKFLQRQMITVGTRVKLSNGDSGVITSGIVHVKMDYPLDHIGNYSRSAHISQFKNAKGKVKPYIIELLYSNEKT